MLGSLRWTTILVIVLCTIVVRSISSEPKILTEVNPCLSKQTCHECIQTPRCGWYSAPNLDGVRCFLANINSRMDEENSDQYMWYPDNMFSVVRNVKLTKEGYSANGSGAARGGSYVSSSSSKSSSHHDSSYSSNDFSSGEHELVQMSPQEVNLKLKLNEPYKMSFAYSQAEDYPVDLYYITDLRNSTLEDKQKHLALGELLAEGMRNITSNFRLGFGTFVGAQASFQPCQECASPYAFKHVMTLSNDTSEFVKLVREAPVLGNSDASEGDFDAIMQAIVCRHSIGWRDRPRRILIISTNAASHHADDGKLGETIRPNDGLCHLDNTGFYTRSSLQDHPSISQINLTAKRIAMNIIWAVPDENINNYKRLSSHVEGSFASILGNDTSNILELIRYQYNNISSSVEMKDTANELINVRYLSSCLDNLPAVERSKCDGLQVGTKVEFIAEIELTICPKNRSEWKQAFDIYPVGVIESLRVNLEMTCDCQCEHGGPMYQENSPECNGFGTLKCGVCDCHERYFGKRCECSSHEFTGFDNLEACRATNDSIAECSGRGTCICGQCECYFRENPEEIISGQFCECDNYSCERHNGQICGGHGTCECGRCVCQDGWKTSDCSSPTSTNS